MISEPGGRVERIGHYRIVSELGRGGMGVVYKAHEESLNRSVAIKVLGEHLEQDEEYVERFVREARSAASLSHPNIVQIYAISEHDGHHYFVMEYVRGTSVQEMIRLRGKLPPEEAVRLVLQAAAGLEEAHAHGVIHRDIKPANLMVTDRGLVKIADFGLALMGGAATRLTATGMLMGTPGYLSPEQCLDQGPDHRTDIYSLGVTLFEMVTGTMPFRADSPLALLKLIVEVDPPDVSDLNPEVDPELRAIVTRMLAKEREHRYASCSDVIADLESWLAVHGVADRATAKAGAGTTAPSPPPPPVATEDEINTHPTVAVDSGAADAPPPPEAPAGPSGFPPTPAEAATAPAPHATAPATQPGPPPRRGRLAWVVAAVVLVLAAGGAAAVVLTVRSGMLDAIIERGKARVVTLKDGTRATAAPDEAPPPAFDPNRTREPVADVPSVADEDDRAAGPVAREAAPAGARPSTGGPVPSDAAADGPPPGRTEGAGLEAPTTRVAPATSEAEPVPEPKSRTEAAVPTGTVVLAVGEQLLAVEAESYVKDRLRRAGIEVVEVTSIPGLEGLVNPESRPEPEQIRAALRPFARFLVALRVAYLGDRPITYMGQRDRVFQSRVTMALVDLRTGRPVGRPTTATVEYTQLKADEAAARQLRRPTTSLVQALTRE